MNTLEQLYSHVLEIDAGTRKPWPNIVELRECAEYAYRGVDAEVIADRLIKVNRDEQPRTIVCHDMRGGYLEDR